MPTEDGKPGDAGATKDDKSDAQPGDAGQSYDDWFRGQDDKTKKLVESNVSGLKSTLDKLKEERRTLKESIDEIRDAKDVDAETKLKTLDEKLQQAERKATFQENLPPEIRNVKAAWTLATSHKCLKRDGSLDLEKFKEQFPEQFTPPRKANVNAGEGTGNPPPTGQDPMNAWLRRQAGV